MAIVGGAKGEGFLPPLFIAPFPPAQQDFSGHGMYGLDPVMVGAGGGLGFGPNSGWDQGVPFISNSLPFISFSCLLLAQILFLILLVPNSLSYLIPYQCPLCPPEGLPVTLSSSHQ